MIAFHGAPIGGPVDARARFYKGRHVLVSFAYPRQLPIIAAVCKSFVLDCGAYTIWRQGGQLDIDGYLAWVRAWERHPAFAWAVYPDVIDGDEAANDALLSRCAGRTFEGVPVWHLHESLGRLSALCTDFPRVALGSSGQWSRPGTPDWWERMNDVMASICDSDGRPMAKLHGLRMLNPNIVGRLPMSSADSSHATRNGGDRKRIHTRIATWQRANLIADAIEAVPAAERWVPVQIRRESMPLFPE